MAKLKTGGFEVVALTGSWHGITAGAASSTYNGGRSGYGPPSVGTMAIPGPNSYRCPIKHCRDKCDMTCLDVGFGLYDSQTVGAPAAVMVEPIQSSAGIIVPPEGYFVKLKALCDERGLLVIFDEAQTGLGRLGSHFAFEQLGIVPDILTLSKTLGNGVPMAATVTSDAIEEECFDRKFLFYTSHLSDPLPAAVGLAVLRVLREENLAARAAEMGKYFIDGLRALQQRYECIGDVRGRGLLIGLEIVKDRESRQPDRPLAHKVQRLCLEMGLVLHAVRADAQSSVRLAPPLTVSTEELDQGIDIMDRAFRRALDLVTGSGQEREARHLLGRQLGKVEVAGGVAGHAVRAVECAAAAADEVAVEVEHADAGDLVSDIDHTALVAINRHGVVEIAPFRKIAPVAIEDLDAVVFPVGDQDPVTRIDPHGVRSAELPGTRAWAAPAPLERAVRPEAVDDRVAVAVRDIDIAVRSDGGARRMIERRLEARFVPRAQREPPRASRIADQHLMSVAVDNENPAIGGRGEAVNVGDLVPAPGPKERAVRVEHEDWGIAALADLQVAVAIDRKVADEAERLALRQPRPAAMHAIAAIAEGNDQGFSAHASLLSPRKSRRSCLRIRDAVCPNRRGLKGAAVADMVLATAVDPSKSFDFALLRGA